MNHTASSSRTPQGAAFHALRLALALAAWDGHREIEDAGAPGQSGTHASHTDRGPAYRDSGGGDSSFHERDASEPIPVECAVGECNLRDSSGCLPSDNCQLLTESDDDAGAPEPLCLRAGAGIDGDPFSSGADCARGFDCTALSGVGVCRRYCCNLNATHECPAEQVCKISLLSPAGDATGVGLCDACDACDPVVQTGCEGAAVCQVLPAESQGACMLCVPRRAGLSEGSACTFADDCQPGAGCFNIRGNQSTCLRLCDSHKPSTLCSAGSSCVELGLAGAPTLGVCVGER